jgi:putative DNA primase/helicase
MRPVPFLERIRQDEMRVDLKDRLRAELHAITAWIIEGARIYATEGLTSPAAVLGATATYKEDSDWFGGFLESRCTISPYAIALAGELHRTYNNWAVENNERPMTPTALGNALRERGFQSHKTGTGNRAWKGLSINTNAGE